MVFVVMQGGISKESLQRNKQAIQKTCTPTQKSQAENIQSQKHGKA
jgi:hypothetical protein